MTPTTQTKSKLSPEKQESLEKALRLMDEIIDLRKGLTVDSEGNPVLNDDELWTFIDKISGPCDTFSQLVRDMFIAIDGAGEDENYATSTPLVKVRNIFNQLVDESDEKFTTEDDILQAAFTLDDIQPADALKALDTLSRSGYIFAPREGTYARPNP